MSEIELKIAVTNKEVSLALLNNSKEEVDKIEIGDGKRISGELLPTLDLLLKRNSLKLESLNKINLESNLSSNFTSSRIAQTMKNILLWSRDRE